MCFYIVLAVRGGDATAIDHVLRQHGRQAKPINNAAIAAIFAPGEAQFLTTVGHCDCGTALATHLEDRPRTPMQHVAKLAKKGWSQAKINRWLDDRLKADDRAEERRRARATDSVELWSRIVHDLLGTPGVQQAGLLLHFYAGDIDEEVFAPSRDITPASDFDQRLREIREDQLLMATG